jgi:hypothetical protein
LDLWKKKAGRTAHLLKVVVKEGRNVSGTQNPCQAQRPVRSAGKNKEAAATLRIKRQVAHQEQFDFQPNSFAPFMSVY